MSWFSITDYAKNALSEAQKKIDKALDIQVKEKVPEVISSSHVQHGNDVKQDNVAKASVESAISKRPKKADFSQKKKAKPSKLGGSTLGAKKITNTNVSANKIFTTLNDSGDIKNSNSSARKTQLAEVSFSEVPLTAHPIQDSVDAENSDIIENTSLSLTVGSIQKAESGFSEVPLTTQCENLYAHGGNSDEQYETSDSTKPQSLETSYSDAVLTVTSEEKKDEEEPVPSEFTITSSVTIESNGNDGHSDTEMTRSRVTPEKVPALVKTSEAKKEPQKAVSEGWNTAQMQEQLSKSLVYEEITADRTVSPTLSTAASSEIDILDHESTASEISSTSKFADGLGGFIRSPIQLPNLDAVDSDASQATSPLPDDKEIKTPTSPKSPGETVGSVTTVSHSFQPIRSLYGCENVQSDSDIESIREIVPQAIPTSPDGAITPKNKAENVSKDVHGSVKMEVTHNVDQKNYLILCEKMEVYEQQLVNLSHKNAQLNEENDNLRSEITRAKEHRHEEAKKEMDQILNSIKACESNNILLKEEKSNLIKQVSVLRSQLASRMTNEQVQNAIAEKEESIKGLMEEGEALSKKHLQQNNLIKKLKSQAQERDSDLKSFKEKVVKFEEENVRLKEHLLQARGQGEEEREASMRISDAYEQRERQTVLLKEKLSDAEEKQRTLQVNLDAAYKEIGDLHKQKAEQESKSVTEWAGREEELRRENDLKTKKILSEQEHQRQLLMLQILELNNSVSRAEAVAARKDDDHRREIREIQQRLQESEARNQDLGDSVSSATRPLLRQIENLQATNSSQQRSWNALEKNLNVRLGEAQVELLAAQENERIAQNSAIEAKSKAAAYEKNSENDKKTLAKQVAEIELLTKQVTELKEETSLLHQELAELRDTHKNIIHKARKERLSLENQLQMEKVRSEAEHKKYTAQQEALQREKDRITWSRSEITSVSSNQIVETESVGSSSDAFHSADLLEKQLSSSSLPGLGLGNSSYEGSRSLSLSTILENLQTQLKLREGEIAQLRGEINMLERTRSSMAEEIVRLTNLNEDMDEMSKELQDTKEKLQEVEGRYGAILTMYGEKVEENDELRMDLDDVKAMYRQQINDLLKADAS